jgi:hypothetical protein
MAQVVDAAESTILLVDWHMPWATQSGRGGGQCVPGAPPTVVLWPKSAVALADNWVYTVDGPRDWLARSAT